MMNDTMGSTGFSKVHPCDTPRGMLFYNLDLLTEKQQRQLNKLKIDAVREDERYLKSHPEIGAFVAIMTKLVLREHRRITVDETVCKYFSRPREFIKADVEEYLNSRQGQAREGTSTLGFMHDVTPSINLSSPPSSSVASVFESFVDGVAEEDDFSFPDDLLVESMEGKIDSESQLYVPPIYSDRSLVTGMALNNEVDEAYIRRIISRNLRKHIPSGHDALDEKLMNVINPPMSAAVLQDTVSSHSSLKQSPISYGQPEIPHNLEKYEKSLGSSEQHNETLNGRPENSSREAHDATPPSSSENPNQTLECQPQIPPDKDEI